MWIKRFFPHAASFNNLLHELIIVHLLCGMHHNVDSQTEHEQAGKITAHVQLNIDKKKHRSNKREHSIKYLIWKIKRWPCSWPSICMNEWMNSTHVAVNQKTQCFQLNSWFNEYITLSFKQTSCQLKNFIAGTIWSAPLQSALCVEQVLFAGAYNLPCIEPTYLSP